MATRIGAAWEGVRGTLSHIPRTLSLVRTSSPALTRGVGAFALLNAVLPLLVVWAGKRIVDAVAAGDHEATLYAVLLEAGLVLIAAAGNRGSALVWQLLGARLSVDINLGILEKARTLTLRHFEDATFYDQLSRARREASSRPLAVVSSTFGLLQNMLGMVGFLGLLTQWSLWALPGLLLAALPSAWVEMKYGTRQFRLRNWRAPETRRLAYLEYVLANDHHAKEVQLFGLGEHLTGRYRTLAESFYREDRALATRRSFAAWGMSLLGTCAFYACYAAMALDAVRGGMTIGDLVLYAAAFRQGQQAFQSVLGALGSMYEDNLYMSNLFAFLDLPIAAPAGAGAPVLPPAPDHEEKGLRFEGVGFRYPTSGGDPAGEGTWALRGIDLFIPAGESLALVGHNGAGKTTFIKLLTGLYTPTEGVVRLDGRDLRAWDPAELRARIGVIFQDFNQYQFTARENVGFGSLARLDDDAQVDRAIRQGGADELVRAWPEGLATRLGRWFEKGLELSGGQWQKIALSRAFMREQADILVLDEPTAALDANAEHQIFERFRELTRGRTSVLISHRFPTVRMADRIIVIEGGTIVEEGGHEELMAQNGRYASLFRVQAAGYL